MRICARSIANLIFHHAMPPSIMRSSISSSNGPLTPCVIKDGQNGFTPNASIASSRLPLAPFQSAAHLALQESSTAGDDRSPVQEQAIPTPAPVEPHWHTHHRVPCQYSEYSNGVSPARRQHW